MNIWLELNEMQGERKTPGMFLFGAGGVFNFEKYSAKTENDCTILYYAAGENVTTVVTESYEEIKTKLMATQKDNFMGKFEC